jgi:hypothetical protein
MGLGLPRRYPEENKGMWDYIWKDKIDVIGLQNVDMEGYQSKPKIWMGLVDRLQRYMISKYGVESGFWEQKRRGKFKRLFKSCLMLPHPIVHKSSENLGSEIRVVKFDEKRNSSLFSPTWRWNVSDSGQPTGTLIPPLNRR